MTGSALAVIVLIATNIGTVVAGWVAVMDARRGIAKENANRRIALEEYADEVGRYHHRIRRYLRQLVEDGVIDIARVDLSQFPPPPAPRYNGGGGKVH